MTGPESSKVRRFQLTEPLVMLATIVQWLVLAIATGALIGAVCTGFLKLLFAIEGRWYDAPAAWLWLSLPLAGLANGLLLHYGYRLRRSTFVDNPIIAVNEQRGKLPFRTMWIKPVAALITLGSGGSAGKEGPCSHIGASLAAAIGRSLGLNREMRKRLLACGVSAGFASVFGTPLAGVSRAADCLQQVLLDLRPPRPAGRAGEGAPVLRPAALVARAPAPARSLNDGTQSAAMLGRGPGREYVAGEWWTEIRACDGWFWVRARSAVTSADGCSRPGGMCASWCARIAWPCCASTA